MPRVLLVLLALLLTPAAAAAQTATKPAPGTPAYVQRDVQNMSDAYGRITGPGGQLRNPAYLPGLVAAGVEVNLGQLAQQAATPTRLALTPGNVFPGWNVGNPLRRGWEGRRGQRIPVAYTNRHGALIRGDVFAPLPGARDPYTNERLRPPYPGVVVTTGSVQGSERMYFWLAQDLAERGYVVLTYDVQGQGTSETLPHEGPPTRPVDDLPFCNPFAAPQDGETLGCPGVPSQQEANFVKGTEDALDFFTSTRKKPYTNRAAGSAQVNAHNPLWKLVDRSRLAIAGHSLGARAVSVVQGTDPRVDAVIALDKLAGGDGGGDVFAGGVKPRVPALAVQSEYGFTVQPYLLNHGSSITPTPGAPLEAPDPRREQRTGFDLWRSQGEDVVLIVPRASTHLEYTDIPLALPASRHGQALTSVYVQAFLRHYLQNRAPREALLARRFRYLEPVGGLRWEPIELDRDAHLSYGFCSGYALGGEVRTDLNGVGCG